jgi:hypothetical protein
MDGMVSFTARLLSGKKPLDRGLVVVAKRIIPASARNRNRSPIP